MNEQAMLSEEKNTGRKVLRKERRQLFTVFICLVLIVIFLHLFGNWSTSHITTSRNNGTELISREIKYTYDNDCLLFNESHTGEVPNNSNSLLWIVLNSFRFTFVDHFIFWLASAGVTLILYGFFKDTKK